MTEIRFATPDDVATILRFVRELAEFERELDKVVATEALLHEAENSPAFARVLRRAAVRPQAFHTTHLKKDALPPAPTAAAVNKMRSAVQKFTEQVSKA